MRRLPQQTLEKLRPLEKELKQATKVGDVDCAIQLAKEIQLLFGSNRSHFRLLKAKLWAFEAALDANRLTLAEPGFCGVRDLANKDTRIYLEATALLSVCYLRQKRSGDAKKLVREVIQSINNISSDQLRHQFQKRFIERIEQECLLSELIGTGDSGSLNEAEMHEQAVLLVQRKSDNEILQLIGTSTPESGIGLLADMRAYSIRLLPPPDQALLPKPETAKSPLNVGRKTMAILKRIAWKSLCEPDSNLYNMWSKQVPEVFNKGYFASAIAATMASWKIGIPLIGAGVAAIAMKSTAEVFCEMTKPLGLMIDRNEQPDDAE